MKLASRVAIALVVLAIAAPAAFAEDWPPYGQSRMRVYFTGTCGVSKSFNGNFDVDCERDHFGYQMYGKWRATYDDDCDTYQQVSEVYEVCTSGSTCSAVSGTWQEITYEQFNANYCP